MPGQQLFSLIQKKEVLETTIAESQVAELGQEKEINLASYQTAKEVSLQLTQEKDHLEEEKTTAKREEAAKIQKEIDKIQAEILRNKLIIEEFEKKLKEEHQKQEEEAQKKVKAEAEESETARAFLGEIANPDQLDEQISELVQSRDDLSSSELPVTPEAEALAKLNKEEETLREELRTASRTDGVAIKAELGKIEADKQQLISKVEADKIISEAARQKDLEDLERKISLLKNEKIFVDRLTSEIANPDQLDDQISELVQSRDDLSSSELPVTPEAEALAKLNKEEETLREELRTASRTDGVAIKAELGKIEADKQTLAKKTELAKSKLEEEKQQQVAEIEVKIKSLEEEKKMISRLQREMDEPGNEELKAAIEIRMGKRESPEQIAEKIKEQERVEDAKRLKVMTDQLSESITFFQGKLDYQMNKIVQSERRRDEYQQTLDQIQSKIGVIDQKIKEGEELVLGSYKKLFGIFDTNKKNRENFLRQIRELDEQKRNLIREQEEIKRQIKEESQTIDTCQLFKSEALAQVESAKRELAKLQAGVENK